MGQCPFRAKKMALHNYVGVSGNVEWTKYMANTRHSYTQNATDSLEWKGSESQEGL